MELLNKSICNKKERPIKVLQFGEGNFLRAFVEWIIQGMNDAGVFNGNVAVVQPMPFGRIKELGEQDGLYTLYLEGLQNGKTIKQHQVIDVLGDYINPFTQYNEYLEYAKSEDLQFIISNTTEAGIALDPTDLDLTVTPKSYPGKLLAFLKTRYEHFNGDYEKGLFIIPCELIDYNGAELKRVLVELAKIHNMDEKFIDWMVNANKYYNTLVDRIVPGYPRNQIKEIEAELGYTDNNIVKGEIFHLWVIEGDPSIQEVFDPRKAGLNVVFTNNIKPYKERKVKILNGSHTAMVPVSYLYGIDTVRETIEDELMGQYVKLFVYKEVVPTIKLPKEEMQFFADSVLERYGNPFVRHELMSIALNSTTKYVTRILPTVLDFYKETNKIPTIAAFSFAALCVFYNGDRNGTPINLQDNPEYLDMWKNLWANVDGSQESIVNFVENLLAHEEIWGLNLNTLGNFKELVINGISSILTKGMKASIEGVVNSHE